MKNPMLASLASILTATMFAACSNKVPTAPNRMSAIAAIAADRQDASLNPDFAVALATMRAATAKYHDVQKAVDDGFALAHACGAPGDEEPTIYANRARVMDGKIDPSLPDALIYEPTSNGPRLVGVELVIPYALWTSPEPPTFFGTPLEREDGPGVFGLHVWIWLHNPNGMLEEINPRVTC